MIIPKKSEPTEKKQNSDGKYPDINITYKLTSCRHRRRPCYYADIVSSDVGGLFSLDSAFDSVFDSAFGAFSSVSVVTKASRASTSSSNSSSLSTGFAGLSFSTVGWGSDCLSTGGVDCSFEAMAGAALFVFGIKSQSMISSDP